MKKTGKLILRDRFNNVFSLFKNIIRLLLRNILFHTIIICIIYKYADEITCNYGLRLRGYIDNLFIIIMHIGIIAGITQLLLYLKNRLIKLIAISIFSVMVFSYITDMKNLVRIALVMKDESVVEIDGVKYIQNRSLYTVSYYKYINVFVSEFEESYPLCTAD